MRCRTARDRLRCGDWRVGGVMSRFGDLEAAIMDVVWAAEGPLRVREVCGQLDRVRPLAFNTVQEYVAGLLGEALAVARDPAAGSPQ